MGRTRTAAAQAAPVRRRCETPQSLDRLWLTDARHESVTRNDDIKTQSPHLLAERYLLPEPASASFTSPTTSPLSSTRTLRKGTSPGWGRVARTPPPAPPLATRAAGGRPPAGGGGRDRSPPGGGGAGGPPPPGGRRPSAMCAC